MKPTIRKKFSYNMEVVFFQRKSRKTGNYSIENYFDGIRENLPKDVQYRIATSKFENDGLFRRIYNIIEAIFRQGDVNHITGEVHYLTFFLRKRKTVLTIHDCRFMETKSKIKRFLIKLIWLDIPLRKAEIVTTISEATKKEILNHVKFDSDKIRVVYVCISKGFKPVKKAFVKEKPTLLQVGTSDNKNLLRLIDAIKGMSCKLNIVGKLNYEQLRALEENKIEYSNSYNLSEEELIAKYQESDLVTFISTYEGFGMPIVEANATDKPVITSNLLSMPEIAGQSAALVNPYDVGEIRSAIKKFIDDDDFRNDLITKGQENLKRFNPQEIANSYYSLYKCIISNNKNGKI